MRSSLAGGLIYFLFAAAYCVMPLFPADAFASEKPLTEYTQTIWTHKDGLPSASIYSIAQTPDGYLWLATADGLVQFDGVRFTHWRPKTGHTALLGVVRTLCAGRDGTLWVGTGSGVVGHGRGDDLTTSFVGPEIQAMLEDANGTLWVMAGGIDIRFLPGKQKKNCQGNARPGACCFRLCPGESG